MRKIKRKDPKKPLKVILTDETRIIVPRQSQFETPWLHDHGCPIVSAYEALQFCGIKKIGKKKMGIKVLRSWFLAHYPDRFRATLTMRGLYLGLKVLLKDVAHVKLYSPAEENAKRVKKFADAGCFLIMNRKIPVTHFYPLIGDYGKDGKRHIYILNAGKCKKTTAKAQMKVKNNSKHYGGMIVITRKKDKKK